MQGSSKEDKEYAVVCTATVVFNVKSPEITKEYAEGYAPPFVKAAILNIESIDRICDQIPENLCCERVVRRNEAIYCKNDQSRWWGDEVIDWRGNTCVCNFCKFSPMNCGRTQEELDELYELWQEEKRLARRAELEKQRDKGQRYCDVHSYQWPCSSIMQCTFKGGMVYNGIGYTGICDYCDYSPMNLDRSPTELAALQEARDLRAQAMWQRLNSSGTSNQERREERERAANAADRKIFELLGFTLECPSQRLQALVDLGPGLPIQPISRE